MKFKDVFNQAYKEAEWDSCCVQCPVKFQNRERGIEFFRMRKIISVGCLRRDLQLLRWGLKCETCAAALAPLAAMLGPESALT